jgi:hypothetical protein
MPIYGSNDGERKLMPVHNMYNQKEYRFLMPGLVFRRTDSTHLYNNIV